MKIETRNVFIANDGAEFYKESDCRRHEDDEEFNKILLSDELFYETNYSIQTGEQLAAFVRDNQTLFFRILGNYGVELS